MNDSGTEILNTGGVGVLLTDTIFGLVGRALNKKAVERIYRIKGRDENKPFIILISSIKDLERFDISPDEETMELLKKFWPGPVSVILNCPSEKFKYLHRNTKSLAFRLPKKSSLRRLIKITGPLVAPSANPQGLPPARTAKEAQMYFGDAVDFYKRGGRPKSKSSTLVDLRGKSPKILRK